MSRVYQALQRRDTGGTQGLVPRGLGFHRAGRHEPDGAGEDHALDARRLFRVLLDRKWEIAAVAGLVFIPVAMATYSAERLYRSSALVQVDPEPLQVLPYREIDLPRSGPNYELFMRSQEQLLTGPTILERLASRLATEPDADALRTESPQLQARLSMRRLPETQMLMLAYVSPQPDVAARVANLYAEEYIKLHFETRQQTRIKARELLERELQDLEQRLQLSEKELVTYAQTHGIESPDRGASLVQEKLSTVASQLSQAEADVFAAQTRVDATRRASTTEFPESLVSPVISGLVARLAQLEQDLAVLLTRFGENWPAVIQKRTEIQSARDQLAQEQAAALARAREQAALELATAENRRKLLASALTEQRDLVSRLDAASIQYNILRREVETSRKMYEGLLERLKQTSVTAGMEFGGFHIVEPARPARQLDSPKVVWNLSLGLLLGLALGVCVALARDYWDTSISTVEEIESLTVMPALGAVPFVAALAPPRGLLGRRRRHPAETTPRATDAAGPIDALVAGALGTPVLGSLGASPESAEAIRNVCASILLSRSGRPPRVLMVTSAVAGEGKTTLVSALGHALADGGARTLLVECDMRRPGFGAVFGTTSEAGLSLFLAGHEEAAPAIHPTAHRNLSVVSAGPSAPNPPALLNSDRLKAFLAEMTTSYQFVILDAPPVLPIADARVLAPLVEGVVLVVRSGMASKHLVRRAAALLEDTGASLLGAVLNGAELRKAAGADYRYYKDYYGA